MEAKREMESDHFVHGLIPRKYPIEKSEKNHDMASILQNILHTGIWSYEVNYGILLLF